MVASKCGSWENQSNPLRIRGGIGVSTPSKSRKSVILGIRGPYRNGLVPRVGFEPTTCRLSGATGYKPAALPLSYRGTAMCLVAPYSEGRVLEVVHAVNLAFSTRRCKL